MAESKPLVDIQLEILNGELNHIGGAIRQHDEITKSVKNWAVVTWTGSIGLALEEPNLHPFLWMTAIVPLVFWIVDGSFRRIQRTFINRVQEISDYVNSPTFRMAVEKGAPLEFPLLLMRRKTAPSRSFAGRLVTWRSLQSGESPSFCGQEGAP